MNKVWVVLAVFSVVTGCAKDYKGANNKNGSEVSYQWLTGKLIPNEFGLPEGTWSDSTIRECITKCSADKNCFGFSVEKKFGEAWEGGSSPWRTRSRGAHGAPPCVRCRSYGYPGRRGEPHSPGILREGRD